MKKFHIKDEDGMEYSVEEIEKEVPAQDEDTSALTEEEILALKKLAAVADKLVSLTTETEDADPEVKKEVNEVLEDEDEDEDSDEEDDEKIVDTDENADKMHDSVNSLAKPSVNDSIDSQLDIASAWAKRYNGGKE